MRKLRAILFVFFTMILIARVSAGQEIETDDYILFLPQDYTADDKKYPLIVALSPGGDARSMIAVWHTVAEEYSWIVCASKRFHNGSISEQVPRIKALIEILILQYPVDFAKITLTGFSGGAMASHLMAYMFPQLVQAVVANTGMINPEYRDISVYPKGKTAVFIASPADFRYDEMKEDCAFLSGLGWNTKWIEFKEGHCIAPLSSYEEAAAWLAEQWN